MADIKCWFVKRNFLNADYRVRRHFITIFISENLYLKNFGVKKVDTYPYTKIWCPNHEDPDSGCRSVTADCLSSRTGLLAQEPSLSLLPQKVSY